MSPEGIARLSIDQLLTAAGWQVCNVADADIHAGTGEVKGVAIRKFPLNTGFGFCRLPALCERQGLRGAAGRVRQAWLQAALLPLALTPQPPPPVPECRDVLDEPFLQLAVAGKAQVLVPGDLDLLVIAAEFEQASGCPILTLDAFFKHPLCNCNEKHSCLRNVCVG